jgi:hypothetical protein
LKAQGHGFRAGGPAAGAEGQVCGAGSRWQDLQLRFKQMNTSADAYTDAATQAENARCNSSTAWAASCRK